jgi:hypothetical protein
MAQVPQSACMIVVAFIAGVTCGTLLAAKIPGLRGPNTPSAFTIDRVTLVDQRVQLLATSTPLSPSPPPPPPPPNILVLYSRLDFDDGQASDLQPLPLTLPSVCRVLPNATIRLITNSDSSVAQALAAGVQAVHTRSFPAPKAAAFPNNYEHHSVNVAVYELACIGRWLYFAAYVEAEEAAGNKFDVVLAVDTDVFLLEPLTAFTLTPEERAASQTKSPLGPYEMIMPIHGATALFSPRTLSAFGAFVSGLYENGAKELHALLPKISGVYNDQVYVSDMYMLKYFISLEPTLRVRHDPAELSCHIFGNADQLEGVTVHRRGSYLYFGEFRVCIVHFQGSAKRAASKFVTFWSSGKDGPFKFEW